MIRELLRTLLSLGLVSISVSINPGCLLFARVLAQELALRTCNSIIFAAPACPLVWGRLLHLRHASLGIFLGRLSGIARPKSNLAGDGSL